MPPTTMWAYVDAMRRPRLTTEQVVVLGIAGGLAAVTLAWLVLRVG
jgi:hypothetical protein